MVSDGDDGAASLGAASGNCPIDKNLYCPLGGCAHTTTKCPSVTFINMTTQDLCFFPMGIGSSTCAPLLNNRDAVGQVFQALFDANPTCNFNIEQDSSGLPHLYAECDCSAVQSVSSAGWTAEGYVYNADNGAIFTADYPTSSPYVTSIGASQFLYVPDGGIKEVICSIKTQAIITTGGGFSMFQKGLDYQQKAVQHWVSTAANKPPAGTYDPTMRGYPDVIFNGHSYFIFYSKGSTDDCNPCLQTSVDGTSASSPAFAGLVGLFNEILLNNQQKPLGFLNPLLYQMAQQDPSTFNDIKEGDNNCNRGYCCLYGYSATPGSWDPVSGLGSPNWGRMLAFIKRRANIQ